MLPSAGDSAQIVDLCEVKKRTSFSVLLKQLHRIHRNRLNSNNTSIIIDGKAVSAVMNSKKLETRLAEVANKVKTVIACRLSPVQKSQLVRMMKSSHARVLDDEDWYIMYLRVVSQLHIILYICDYCIKYYL